MHAKLLFHVFNTTPKLNLCMFSSEMAHTPCTLSSVHVEYPTIKFRGDGSHSGQVMARKHMAHCASEPLRTLLTRTSPPHLAQLPEPHLPCFEIPPTPPAISAGLLPPDGKRPFMFSSSYGIVISTDREGATFDSRVLKRNRRGSLRRTFSQRF